MSSQSGYQYQNQTYNQVSGYSQYGGYNYQHYYYQPPPPPDVPPPPPPPPPDQSEPPPPGTEVQDGQQVPPTSPRQTQPPAPSTGAEWQASEHSSHQQQQWSGGGGTDHWTGLPDEHRQSSVDTQQWKADRKDQPGTTNSETHIADAGQPGTSHHPRQGGGGQPGTGQWEDGRQPGTGQQQWVGQPGTAQQQWVWQPGTAQQQWQSGEPVTNPQYRANEQSNVEPWAAQQQWTSGAQPWSGGYQSQQPWSHGGQEQQWTGGHHQPVQANTAYPQYSMGYEWQGTQPPAVQQTGGYHQWAGNQAGQGREQQPWSQQWGSNQQWQWSQGNWSQGGWDNQPGVEAWTGQPWGGGAWQRGHPPQGPSPHIPSGVPTQPSAPLPSNQHTPKKPLLPLPSNHTPTWGLGHEGRAAEGSTDQGPPGKEKAPGQGNPQEGVLSTSPSKHHTPSPEDDRTPPPPPLAQKERAKGGQVTPDNWPPRLHAYINRAFEACTNDKERDMVQEFLQVELREVFEKAQEWTINWDVYSLPMDRGMDQMGRKRKSRWDTPSPVQVKEPRGVPPSPLHPASEEDGEGPGFGRGRRRRKKKKGKTKFVLDKQPAASAPPPPPLTEAEQARINSRAHRFSLGQDGHKNFRKKITMEDLLRPVNGTGLDYDNMNLHVEGTSTALEKQYLRLTAAPDPSTVRPEPVLQRSLEHVSRKWAQVRDYHYACEQFKSIRQDLTIQGIRNQFTVNVYEKHARIALENNDRQEFNQCQTQLKALYSEGLGGSHEEFLAYRILYSMLTENTADLSSALKEIPRKLRFSPCINHALRMRSAWALGNYHVLFKLYKTVPNTGRCLVDMFVERERKAAFKAMAKASIQFAAAMCVLENEAVVQPVVIFAIQYRPNVQVSYAMAELGFESMDECVSFLTAMNVVFIENLTLVDCKATASKL